MLQSNNRSNLLGCKATNIGTWNVRTLNKKRIAKTKNFGLMKYNGNFGKMLETEIIK